MGFIKEKQDLTYLKWSYIRNSSGTAGTFLKSESTLSGKKIYYKLSNFDSMKGVIGHKIQIPYHKSLRLLQRHHVPILYTNTVHSWK